MEIPQVDKVFPKNTRGGFTLVEIVAVLLIISILLLITYSGVDRLKMESRKTHGATSLKTIAEAYRQYTQDQGHPIRWKDLDLINNAGDYDVSLIAAELARLGYLSSADAWVWDFDYKVRDYRAQGKDIPQRICDIQRDASGKIKTAKVNPNFRGRGSNQVPFSVCACVAGNTCTADDFLDRANEIPIAFSRGLRERINPGTWAGRSENYDRGGVFGADGGLVVYLDGRVEWYKNLGTAMTGAVKKYGTNEVTQKIVEALPFGGLTNFIGTKSSWLAGNGSGTDCTNF